MGGVTKAGLQGADQLLDKLPKPSSSSSIWARDTAVISGTLGASYYAVDGKALVLEEFLQALRTRLATIPSTVDSQSLCSDLLRGTLRVFDSMGSLYAKREGLNTPPSLAIDAMKYNALPGHQRPECTEAPVCANVQPAADMEKFGLVDGLSHPGVELEKGVIVEPATAPQEIGLISTGAGVTKMAGGAGSVGALQGMDAPSICSILLDVVRVLDKLRANADEIGLSSASLDEEEKRYVQLERTVSQLFEVHGFYLSTKGEYRVAFLKDMLKAEKDGNLAGVIAKTVEFPKRSREDLLGLPCPFSETASKVLAVVSLRAVAVSSPRKPAALNWMNAVRSSSEKEKENNVSN